MEDSDHEDIGREFSKMFRFAETNGYREGIINGTEAIYQQCFDSGFAKGIKLGLTLGFFESLLSSIEQNETNVSEDVLEAAKARYIKKLLADSGKRNCHLCKDDTLMDASLENLENKQNTVYDSVIRDLFEKYSFVLNELGITPEQFLDIPNE